jgi:hypothetical protein
MKPHALITQPQRGYHAISEQNGVHYRGNSGIGLATARLFVAEGAKVAITGRNQATLEAAAKELGPNALAIVADANDIAATEAAVKRAVEKFGKLDVVFANAGIPGNTPVGSTTLEAFESVIRTNITSVFFTVQAAAPHLNEGASIILNGSVISVLGNPGYAAYAASKAGVRAMARVMASELRLGISGSTSFRREPRGRPYGMAWRPHPKRLRRWTSAFPAASRSGGLVKPRKLQRQCCSSPPTTRPMSRARRYSSTAARPVHRPVRRFIVDSAWH